MLASPLRTVAPPMRERWDRWWTSTALLVLLLLSRTGATLQTDLSLTQLQHTAWKTSDGAPADIWALTQSPDGFLLLGTGRGLFRFDGVIFERIVLPDKSDAAFRNVTALTSVSPQELWMGYYAGGVSHLKDGVLTNFTQMDGIPKGWVTSFAQESNGTLWVAALEGLGRFADGRWEIVSSNWSYPGNSAHWVLLDRTGTLWVAGGDTVAFLRRGSRKFEDTGIRSGYASTLALAPDGAVWLAGESIVPRPLTQNGSLIAQPITSSKLDSTKRLLIDKDGAIWATDASRGGIYRSTERVVRDPDSGSQNLPATTERFGESSGLTSDKSVPIFEDREGNIWVGSNLGLNRFRATPFVPESRVPATSRMGYSFAAAPDGHVWISSDNDIFEVHGSSIERVMHLPTRIRSAYRDLSGALWLGTEKGLVELNNHEQKFVPLPPSSQAIPYEYVHAIASDGAQGLWISVINRGLLRLHDDAWEVPAAPLNLGATAPTALWTDGAQRQWFGYSDGTVRMREGTSTRVYGSNDGLRVGPITLIRGSGPGIFVAGEWGLARLQDNQFQTLSASRSDAFSGITGIIVGAKDDIWLNGNRGVVYMTSLALADAYREPQSKLRFELYDVHDGLPGYAQQNEDATAIASSDGKLWFATNHGVAWVDPGHRPRNRLAPDVVIRNFRVDGRNYPTVGLVEIPRLAQSLRIDYTALSLVAPERVSFRYQLEGADDGWRYAANERSVSYADLHPGRYTFRVTASNNDGVWSEAGTSISFVIPPAYYQTTWFLIALGLLFAGFLWFTYYMRLRHVTERQRKRIEQRMEDRFSERTRIARELHDTLLQSLQGSLMRYQVAHELLPEHPSEAKQDLGKAIDQTVHAISEGRNAVQGLRAIKADTNDLADSIKTLVEELALNVSPQERVFRVGLQGTPQPLRAAVLNEIYDIAGEALRNARQHSQATEIEVELHYDADQLRLRIRDNGIGIDPKFLNGQGATGHYGLCGMRERAELVGGNLAIWSAPAAGAEVELIIPAAQAYVAAQPRRFLWLSRVLSKRISEALHE
jgi:signal transduction histidine kinase/ligand-binding sensor domain-containing protein